LLVEERFLVVSTVPAASRTLIYAFLVRRLSSRNCLRFLHTHYDACCYYLDRASIALFLDCQLSADLFLGHPACRSFNSSSPVPSAASAGLRATPLGF
jgi:hypothetical protein